MRGHIVRDVEKHLKAPDAHAAASGYDQFADEAISAPLFRGLCQGPQGPVRGHSYPGADYHIADHLLCADLTARVRGPGRY